MTTPRRQIARHTRQVEYKSKDANVSRCTITIKIMDKASSVFAAFEAGKLPSTQQFNQFIDWLNDVGIAQLEPTSNTELSAQGRVLANDLRHVLEAYKTLGSNKNCPFLILLYFICAFSDFYIHLQRIISCRKPFGT